MKEVTIRYYGSNLLLTVDLNFLFSRLASQFRDLERFVIEVMDEDEKVTAAETDKHGIIMVRERIHIYIDSAGDRRRLRDLEREVEDNSP